MPTHDGVVVARHATGEAALVIELLSRDSGRVACLARSGRSSRHRFPGGLDVLSRVQVDVQPQQKSSGLPMLTQATVTHTWPALRTDPLALGRGAYVAELATALTPREHPDPVTFDLVIDVLDVLEAHGAGGAGLLRWAEVHLLVHAGVLPPTHACSLCQAALGADAASAAHVPGQLHCGRCRSAQDPMLGTLMTPLLTQIMTWNAEAAHSANVAIAAARAVGQWLAPVIHATVGHRLKSADFLRQLQRAPAPGPLPRA